MGKGHRLLKKVKSEKAKVKIKVTKTKFLPKGTNVTDTTFKVKQIVIREQLKVSDQNEPLSKRQLNIKELLTRLQHYNSTVRTDAVKGLKELVTLYPEQVVIENLSQLLQAVSPLVLDKEKTVRREILKLIAMIISPVSTEKITPFFDILCSYLRCAMTHIDSNIQEDSLLLLDNLLACVPSLVAISSKKILPNFFDLISKLRSDAGPGRTLTVSLGNKITGIKWRVKVLNRLYGILDAIIMDKVQKHKHKCSGFVAKTVYFDEEKDGHIPLYRNDYMNPVVLNLQDINKNITANKDNDGEIVEYVDVLVPLLFDTWLEVGPGTKTEENNLDSTLREEAAVVLNCSLSILQLLWKFITIYQKDIANNDLGDNFISKYHKDFSNYIVKLFPYTQTGLKKRKKGESNSDILADTGCTNENLMICHLFCVFNKKIVNDTQIKNAKKITKYVQACLTHKTQNNNNKQLFIVLKCLLLDISKSWHSSNLDLTNILDSTIKFYQNTKLSENAKYELFNILAEIVNLQHLNRRESFQIWLSKLPELLLQSEIYEKNIDIICLLAKQKNNLFINSLVGKYSEILDNMPNLKIINCENKNPIIFKIIGLFFWVPIFDKNNLDILKNFLKNNSDEIIKKYFLNLLQLRYEIKNETIVLEYLQILK